MLRTLLALLRMVKIEHSVFALPFAYIGMFWAAGGWPGWRVFLLVTLAMVSMRTLAMAANRLVDLPFDRANPRTAGRPLVTGEISLAATRWLCLGCAVVFVAACAGLNATVLALAPLALFLACGYSYTKRFTWLCHFWLGAVLGLTPLAGWLATGQGFHLAPVLLGLGVVYWVAGFDVIYALQDLEFDRSVGLCSIPVRFGTETSLTLAAFCHANTALFFLLAGLAAGAGWPYFLTAVTLAGLLAYEHAILSPRDLSRLGTAFFTINGVIALALLAGVVLDVFAL